jgi:hypothetical protein
MRGIGAQARLSIPPLRIALDLQFNRFDVLTGAASGSYAVHAQRSPHFAPAAAVSPSSNDA